MGKPTNFAFVLAQEVLGPEKERCYKLNSASCTSCEFLVVLLSADVPVSACIGAATGHQSHGNLVSCTNFGSESVCFTAQTLPAGCTQASVMPGSFL